MPPKHPLTPASDHYGSVCCTPQCPTEMLVHGHMAYWLHYKNISTNTMRLLTTFYLRDWKRWTLINSSNRNDNILFHRHPVLRFLSVFLQAAPYWLCMRLEVCPAWRRKLVWASTSGIDQRCFHPRSSRCLANDWTSFDLQNTVCFTASTSETGERMQIC